MCHQLVYESLVFLQKSLKRQTIRMWLPSLLDLYIFFLLFEPYTITNGIVSDV